MRALRFLVLAAALTVSFSVAFAQAPDLSSPKKAGLAFAAALDKGDADGVKAASFGSAADVQLFVELAELNAAQGEFAKWMSARFGPAGEPKKTPGLEPDVQAAEEKVGGEVAALRKDDGSTVLRLRKSGGAWKVDLERFPTYDQVSRDRAQTKARGRAFLQAAEDIKAGKFKTVAEANAAASAKPAPQGAADAPAKTTADKKPDAKPAPKPPMPSDDPALIKLDAARAEHDQTIEAAKAKLMDAVDNRLKSATAKGELKDVEAITAIKNALEEQGKVPDGTKDKAVLEAVRTRDRSISVADSKLLSAYDQAIRDLTKAAKLDEAKALAKEKEGLGLGKAGAEDNPSEFWVLGGNKALPTFFQPNRGAFNVKDGLRIKEDALVRTKDAGLLKRDFVFDVVYSIDEGHNIMIVGFGEGVRAGNNLSNGAVLRICGPQVAEGLVQLSGTRSGDAGIGNIRQKGTHMCRMEKTGDVLTFSFCINYDGKFNPDLSRAITNIREFAPELNDKNTHIFIGNAGTGCTFKQTRLRFTK